MVSLTAIVLAAGASKRFGPENKLHAPIGETTVLNRLLSTIAASDFDEVIVVSRSADLQAQRLIQQFGFTLVINHQASNGIGSSVAAGVQAVQRPTPVAVFLGDLPFIKTETIAALRTAFENSNSKQIVRPVYNNQVGHPVFFPASSLDGLRRLKKDIGAKNVLRRQSARLTRLEVNDSGVCDDIDHARDLGTRA